MRPELLEATRASLASPTTMAALSLDAAGVGGEQASTERSTSAPPRLVARRSPSAAPRRRSRPAARPRAPPRAPPPSRAHRGSAADGIDMALHRPALRRSPSLRRSRQRGAATVATDGTPKETSESAGSGAKPLFRHTIDTLRSALGGSRCIEPVTSKTGAWPWRMAVGPSRARPCARPRGRRRTRTDPRSQRDIAKPDQGERRARYDQIARPTGGGDPAEPSSDAIRLGLENNLDVELARFDPLIAGEDAMIAWGAYDPVALRHEYQLRRRQRADRQRAHRREREPRPAAQATRVSDGLVPLPGRGTVYDLDFIGQASVERSRPDLFAGASRPSSTRPSASGREPCWCYEASSGTSNWTRGEELPDRQRLQRRRAVPRQRHDGQPRRGSRTLYWELVANAEQLRVARKSLRDGVGAPRSGRRRSTRSGVVSKVEVVEAEAGVAEREFNLIQAENAYRNGAGPADRPGARAATFRRNGERRARAPAERPAGPALHRVRRSTSPEAVEPGLRPPPRDLGERGAHRSRPEIRAEVREEPAPAAGRT